MKKSTKALFISDIITVILFAIITLGLLTVNVLAPKEKFSYTERRSLADFPSLSLVSVLAGSDDFSSDFEKYFEDNFIMRDHLRRLCSAFSENVLLLSDFNGYYTENGSIGEIEYPQNDEYIKSASSYINRVKQKYFTDCNRVYLSVIPDKSEYTQRPSVKAEDISNNIISSLDFSIASIDISDTLSFDSYYNTDIHWKQELLFPAAEKICLSLGVTPLSESFAVLSELGSFYGGLLGQSALSAEPDTLITVFSEDIKALKARYSDASFGSVYEKSLFYESYDKYDVFLRGEVLDISHGNNIIIIENEKYANNVFAGADRKSEKGKKLILFRDSFARSLVPLISKDYETIILIDVRTPLASYKNFTPELAFDANTDILFLISAKVLNTTLLR